MLCKVLTFEDYEGNSITQKFWFHLSKSDMARMELTEGGEEGLSKVFETLIASKDRKKIIATFESIIMRSYGVRDPEDPTQFRKSEDLSEMFKDSAAYDALFTELITNTDSAAQFMIGIVPKDMQSKLAEVSAEEMGTINPLLVTTEITPDHTLTLEELLELPEEKQTEYVMTHGLPDPAPEQPEEKFWLTREPTKLELQRMTAPQIAEAMKAKMNRRKTS